MGDERKMDRGSRPSEAGARVIFIRSSSINVAAVSSKFREREKRKEQGEAEEGLIIAF